MTYCLGMLLDDGLIMMADTRTNAGIDNFSTFRKLHRLVDMEDRLLVSATAGSLSVSQSVISMLVEDHIPQNGDEVRRLADAPTMFVAAQLVGRAVEQVNATVGAALDRAHVDSDVELLLGGRIGYEPLRLFLVYSAGNFIECTSEVPFVQIGETKYGRPILDRTLSHESPLDEAVKIGLLSFDSTMKSNLGVARPIDVIVVPAHPDLPIAARRIPGDDPYFDEITRSWASLLRHGTQTIPNPSWVPGRPGSRRETIARRA